MKNSRNMKRLSEPGTYCYYYGFDVIMSLKVIQITWCLAYR